LQLNLQIYSRTLQERSTSVNSIPCAYFRVFLHDCAIHSSSFVGFAGLGLVGVHFFVRLVKILRSFLSEATACLRCFRVFGKLGSVTYAAICCLFRMAIMFHQDKGFKDIFRPHTKAFACYRCGFLIPRTAGVNSFLGVR
jgi:hypothetical protein